MRMSTSDIFGCFFASSTTELVMVFTVSLTMSGNLKKTVSDPDPLQSTFVFFVDLVSREN